MGFGPSSGWAQCLTEFTTATAQLPEDRRLVIDAAAPSDFPLWASICDDIWTAEETDRAEPAVTGPEWLKRTDSVLESLGVQSHPDKMVDGAENAEVQGSVIHSTQHWV